VPSSVIEFVDANGNVPLRPDGTPISRQVSLEAGRSAFVQFPAAALLGRDEVEAGGCRRPSAGV